MGATVNDIIINLSAEFLKLVVYANIIALPVSYFIMKKWLEEFAYRLTLSWTVFIFAGVLSVFITVITIAYQAIKAATSNPIDALKYE